MGKARIILTGSTGLIGSSIRLKIKDLFSLIEINSSGIKYPFNSKTDSIIKLENSSKFSKYLDEVKPEFIIHCASKIPSKFNSDSPELAEYNNKIDDSIFNAILNTNCKLIYISSTIVYGYPNSELNINENDPNKSESFYGNQKITSENYILSKIPNSLILRINAPYGNNMRSDTVITKFIKKALLDDPIYIFGSGNRMQDFTNSKDIADCIIEIIKTRKNISGVFNLSYGEPISMLNLAKKIIYFSKSKSQIIFSNEKDSQENHKASYSICRAKEDLNWSPKISIDEGILELIKHLK